MLKEAKLALAVCFLVVGYVPAGHARVPFANRPLQRDGKPQAAATATIRGGVVAADTGAPLRRARLVLSGEQLPQPLIINTDAGGKYQFSDLPPGRYRLTASRNGYLKLSYAQRRPNGLARPLDVAAGEVLERIDFALPRMSVISGRITDEFHEPLEGCTVTAFVHRNSPAGRRLVPSGVASTDASGTFRILSLLPGDYWLQATSTETWTVEKDGSRDTGSYSATFYPGTTDLQGALPVRVGIGQEAARTDFALAPGRVASISGMAFSSKGAPLIGRPLMLSQEALSSANGAIGGFVKMFGSTTVASDGSFEFAKIPTGKYKVIATLPATNGDPAEVASVPVSVGEADIEALIVTTSPGASITGRVETENGSPLPTSASRMRVLLDADGPNTLPLRTDPSSGIVDRQGGFTVKGVFGPVAVNVGGLPAAWSIKAVYVGDREIDRDAFEPSDSEPVRIVLTNRTGGVEGVVLSPDGTQASDFIVILFSTDESAWMQHEKGSVRAARADLQRRFSILHVQPGEYHVAALDDTDPDQWYDPDFLRELARYSTTVQIGDGRLEPLQLRLIGTR